MVEIFWNLLHPVPESIFPDFLSPVEQEKLATLRFAKRRSEWLLGRWASKQLLRAVDEDCRAIPPQDITIQNEPAGAPFVTITGQGLLPGCLSISHRAETAFCAYSAEEHFPIGADLELIEPGSTRYLEDFLSPEEIELAHSLPDGEREKWVFLVWSAKEALLKALRIGMRTDTRLIQVQINTKPSELIKWGDLHIQTSLPGTEGLRCWWRQEGSFILTLAALPAASNRFTDHRIHLIESIPLAD